MVTDNSNPDDPKTTAVHCNLRIAIGEPGKIKIEGIPVNFGPKMALAAIEGAVMGFYEQLSEKIEGGCAVTKQWVADAPIGWLVLDPDDIHYLKPGEEPPEHATDT